jgi:hypothetical protein
VAAVEHGAATVRGFTHVNGMGQKGHLDRRNCLLPDGTSPPRGYVSPGGTVSPGGNFSSGGLVSSRTVGEIVVMTIVVM